MAVESMSDERYIQLMWDETTQLTTNEIAAGWHFCPEFVGLLTQGEKGPQECYCGTFKDGVWV